jgi:hypothetical protein
MLKIGPIWSPCLGRISILQNSRIFIENRLVDEAEQKKLAKIEFSKFTSMEKYKKKNTFHCVLSNI